MQVAKNPEKLLSFHSTFLYIHKTLPKVLKVRNSILKIVEESRLNEPCRECLGRYRASDRSNKF